MVIVFMDKIQIWYHRNKNKEWYHYADLLNIMDRTNNRRNKRAQRKPSIYDFIHY
jgi:hypothetical protein